MTKLAAITLTVVVVVAAVAGQDRPLVFQVGSELVVMDLIATDESGREVSDLTRSEIQIVEDGSPRPVQQLQLISRSVELHDRGLPAGTARAAPQPAAVAAAPEPAPEPPASSSRSISTACRRTRCRASSRRFSTA
jgi:hypothetical protein